jgi:hypothetical protein
MMLFGVNIGVFREPSWKLFESSTRNDQNIPAKALDQFSEPITCLERDVAERAIVGKHSARM